MILFSKASPSFTEWGWSAQLFLVRELCKVYSVPSCTNVICPMLCFCMKMYQVYPNTTHKIEVGITKITSKISKETRNWQRVERYSCHEIECPCLSKYCVRWMRKEKCKIFTPIDFLVWQVARRCWSGNDYAYEMICQTMKENPALKVTLPHKVVDENILEQALKH